MREEAVEFADDECAVEDVEEEVEDLLGVDALIEDGVVYLGHEADGQLGQRLSELDALGVAVPVPVADVELDLAVELYLLHDTHRKGVEGLLHLPVLTSDLCQQLLAVRRDQPEVPLLVSDQLGIAGHLPGAEGQRLLELLAFEEESLEEEVDWFLPGDCSQGFGELSLGTDVAQNADQLLVLVDRLLELPSRDLLALLTLPLCRSRWHWRVGFLFGWDAFLEFDDLNFVAWVGCGVGDELLPLEVLLRLVLLDDCLLGQGHFAVVDFAIAVLLPGRKSSICGFREVYLLKLNAHVFRLCLGYWLNNCWSFFVLLLHILLLVFGDFIGDAFVVLLILDVLSLIVDVLDHFLIELNVLIDIPL